MSITRKIANLLLSVGSVTFLLGVLAFPAVAQTNKASIVGTVTDTSGAVVPGVTVKITKVDTNATREVTTSDSGTYEAPSLDIGTYKVTGTKQGFKTVAQENIVLQTNDRLRIDLAMSAGDISGEVTITAAAPLVETESSNRGNVVTGREVTELPLSGRNFTQLATLMPGVAASSNTGFGGTGPDARQFNNGDPRAGSGGPGASNSQGSTENSRFARSGSGALTVNGQRSTNNNFSLDGVDNNEPQFGTIGVFPNPDAIAEFKVTTSVPPAEVGRAAGESDPEGDEGERLEDGLAERERVRDGTNEVIRAVTHAHRQPEPPHLVAGKQERRAEALNLEGPACLADEARPDSVRAQDEERREAGKRDADEADTAEQRLPAAVPAPDVDEHRRQKYDREELRCKGQPEQGERQASPSADEQRERSDSQGRGPEVETREDNGPERERAEGREPKRGGEPEAAALESNENHRHRRDREHPAETH